MDNQDKQRQVHQVLTITLFLNLLVAFGKIIIGLLSGALAITADGFHSLLDGTSNIISLIAIRIATQPPDDNHPYGHRRFETFAALVISMLLILAAWEIAMGAIDRLQSGKQPELTLLTFALLIGTLAVNIGVSTHQIQRGTQLNSEILLADAANTRTDVYVTLSVLVSMGIVWLTGWAWVDVVAALVVVGLIVHAAWRILSSTGVVLVDTAPYMPDQIETSLGHLPAVSRVLRARSRGPLDAVHIDVDLQVAPQITTDHTEAITQVIRERLDKNLGGIVEVEVHFVPDATDTTDYVLGVRAAADRLGLATHEVAVIDTDHGKVLETHVEVPNHMTLTEAHSLVSLLERNLKEQNSEISEVITHIEPTQIDDGRMEIENVILRDQALTLLHKAFPRINWHDLRLYDRAHGYNLTLHAALKADVTVEAAHDMAEHAETILRSQLPQLQRVTIHTEPHDHL